MDSQIRKYTFKEPKFTDRKLDFSTYHTLVMAVAQSLGINLSREETIPTLRLMELDEDLPAYDESDADAGYMDKKATCLYLDETTKTWKRDETQQKQNVSNPFSGVSGIKGDRSLFLYLAQCARFVPFPGSPATGGNWIEFTPTQTFSTSDAAFSASITAVHGTIPDKAGTTVTINNTKNAFSGNASTLGICANYDAEAEAYFCVNLGCPPA